jgi:hypothetical protein
VSDGSRNRQRLVQAGLISPFDYAPGFIALLPRGVRAVDLLHGLYGRSLEERMAVRVIDSPSVETVAAYREDYGATYDYQNFFSLQLDGGMHVVRPDSLASMVKLSALLPDVALLNPRPLFRAETADPAPLIRDRHLWGALQCVHHVASEPFEPVWEAHAAAFASFLTAIKLPSLAVQAPPLREHAERRLLTFSLTADGRLWLTSTLYLLSPHLVRPMGATGRVIELGFTAKLIALVVGLHADDAGPILPSHLAPTQVLLATAPADLEHDMRMGGLRVERAAADRTWANALKRARREGIPVLLGQRDENRDTSVATYLRASDGRDPVPRSGLLDTITSALDAHDATLWHRAEVAQEGLMTPLEDARFGDGPTDDHDFVLGRVVDANFALGREATEHGALLLSRKRRLY